METSVKLQEPFSYNILPMIIVGIIIIGLLIFFVTDFIIKMSHKKKEVPVLAVRTEKNVAQIKAKYLREIWNIENDFEKNSLSIRHAYQKMSRCIRKFVHEMTGIKVQNYTLQDIKMLNMPVLEELIKEYYVPEFSKQSSGNVKESLEKTKRAIERWN